MRHKKSKLFLLFLILAAAGYFFVLKPRYEQSNGEETREVKPALETVENIVSTTGLILPKNRLEVKPPVNGRIDTILVKEGQIVKAGQTIGWMSSTERAALLDAARGQGEQALKYWQEVYKPIPLISPISGEVIVATTQPGQTITASDAFIVLSDQLIVRAQVDETDIGKVKTGQNAVVSLDAYPDTNIKATVDHIYYESTTVNNVTIYQVDLMPEKVPDFFRSGMNSNVSFVISRKENALMLPAEAVFNDNGESFVLIKDNSEQGFSARPVKLGVSQEKEIEIISGITADDTVVIKTKKYALPRDTTGTNPFMPLRRPAARQPQR